jgi:hypothetical protein
MNDELEGMWKEAAVAWFKVLSRNLAGKTEENHKNPRQDSRSLGQDSNSIPVKYKAVVLTAQTRRSVRYILKYVKIKPACYRVSDKHE